MKTISEIYEEYKIMPSLAEHMLRVTAVASQLCDSCTVTVDKNLIITACLVHDLGNILKFDLESFPEFLEPYGLEYWQDVKNEYIAKYGEDEHVATIAIIRELNLPDEVIHLVDNVGHNHFCDQLDREDFNHKIINYADVRVAPYGVVSYTERMDDVTRRYKSRPNFIGNEKHETSIACGYEIEKQIFSYSSIKPEDITDEAIAHLIEELKDFVIK